MQLSFFILLGILSFSHCQFGGPGYTGGNTNPCASHSCPQNFRCVVQAVQCFNPPCNQIAQCQPFQNQPTRPSCQNIRCGFNQFCELRRIRCFRGPCYPVPQCVNRRGGNNNGRPIGY